MLIVRLHKSSRLLLLIVALMVLVPAAYSTEQGERSATARRRNVLLLISDDQGKDVVGCYGNPVIKTPNQDRLAGDGVRFTRAFSTVASCSPSRAVILTGLYQHTNGQYGLAHATHHQKTFAWVESLPRLLGNNGYRTAIIGKEHVEPQSVYPFQARITADLQGNRGVAQMAERAREIFTSRDERPFFLVVGYADPHREGHGGEEQRSEWKSFANEEKYPGIEKITYRPGEVRVPYFLPDRPEVRQELVEYYEAVSRLDQGIGLVMKALKETGKLDETLIIYISDNGIPFPGAKTTLYDPGLHLPMIIRSPVQAKRGVVNNAMVSWLDIAPTILDWAGVRASYQLPGKSIMPILEQENPTGWDTVFASHTTHEITMYYPMRAIRTRRYKLIWNLANQLPYPHADDLWHSPTWQGILRRGDGRMGERTTEAYLRRPEYELFDLEKDPHEMRSVTADPVYREALVDLQRRLRRMMMETKDPWTAEFRYRRISE